MDKTVQLIFVVVLLVGTAVIVGVSFMGSSDFLNSSAEDIKGETPEVEVDQGENEEQEQSEEDVPVEDIADEIDAGDIFEEGE